MKDKGETTEAIQFDALEILSRIGLRHLSQMALLLGALSILIGWAVGSYTYITSRKAALEFVHENNLNLARSLSQYADILGEPIENPELLIELQKMWEATHTRYPGRYLCILIASDLEN